MSEIIEVDNVTFGYDGRPVLKDLTFGVAAGTFLAISGPNGAGKTTLLDLLCGVLRPGSGSVRIDRADIHSYSIRELARTIAVVRQEFVPVFEFTVTEVVLMARTPYLSTFGFESATDRELAAKALEITDVAQFADRPLSQLSGGERQRVFIARAFAQDTGILLLDEPTSFLDMKHQVGIYDLLKKMQLEQGKTIVTVTHDINLAAQYSDHALLLAGPQAGCRWHIGKTRDIFTPGRIEEVFGVRTFTGRLGREKFFLPLGEYAKDADVLSSAAGTDPQD